ncbi:hypothetical protein CHS0354_035712 [Potamilus streckersoni]|uniref:Spermatogenesis-associated protein 6 N-terminal domain-containing protein n=1 Tax=Potamilus streckersoni TaxID=2493646 RepID=A0AAE0TCR0_9BIVA|nr:hypothetical protein CHS0354_035712 [Potamilus streckersoni]
MPRRALRCVVDLDINRVSAPGVWLPSREDVYLSISLFGQYRNTRTVISVFPLILHEHFRFEKTYYTAVDPAHVAEFLEDELVIFELVQLCDYSDGAIRLASFSTDARDFLYPYPTLAPSYAPTEREILMSRTVAFPGISPKIEFTSKTTIKESRSPELDALEDAMEEREILRARSRSRTRSRSRQRTRSLSAHSARSKSPAARKVLEEVSSNRIPQPTSPAEKPPFVVRHLDSSLIGRKPGSPTKVKKGKKKRSKTPVRRLSLGEYDFTPLRKQYHLKEVIRDRSDSPLPVFESKYLTSDEEDEEVAALTSRSNVYIPPPRPRSVSPILYTPSYRSRFSDGLVEERVSRRIERALNRSMSPRYGRQSPYLSSLSSSLDDLEIETKLVKNRSLEHLDPGLYWTQRYAKLSQRPYRRDFNEHVASMYKNLYSKATNRVQT